MGSSPLTAQFRPTAGRAPQPVTFDVTHHEIWYVSVPSPGDGAGGDVGRPRALEENRMADDKKGEMSRRSFLRNAAVGAAAVGAAVAAPNVAKITENVGGAGSQGDPSSPMVAYVK